jgi:hypothetical protein
VQLKINLNLRRKAARQQGSKAESYGDPCVSKNEEHAKTFSSGCIFKLAQVRSTGTEARMSGWALGPLQGSRMQIVQVNRSTFNDCLTVLDTNTETEYSVDVQSMSV